MINSEIWFSHRHRSLICPPRHGRHWRISFARVATGRPHATPSAPETQQRESQSKNIPSDRHRIPPVSNPNQLSVPTLSCLLPTSVPHWAEPVHVRARTAALIICSYAAKTCNGRNGSHRRNHSPLAARVLTAFISNFTWRSVLCGSRGCLAGRSRGSAELLGLSRLWKRYGLDTGVGSPYREAQRT